MRFTPCVSLSGELNVEYKVLLSTLLAASLSLPAVALQPKQQESAVKSLVQEFLKAEQAYDALALSQLIDAAYVEVSPAGEVDEHDRFLGFYAPEKKAPWPDMSTSEEQVRLFGDTAVDVLKFTYHLPGPDGTTHTREVRGSFIAQKGRNGWKLLGAHYTGIRTPSAN